MWYFEIIEKENNMKIEVFLLLFLLFCCFLTPFKQKESNEIYVSCWTRIERIKLNKQNKHTNKNIIY
jgi:diacylglycerol kinase